jgi:hypothetical protein
VSLKAPRIPGTEVDYWHKLTPEERAFVKQFNDEEAGYFCKKKRPLRPRKEKRAIGRQRHASRRDAYAKWGRVVSCPINATPHYTPELEEVIDALASDAKLSDFLGKPKA